MHKEEVKRMKPTRDPIPMAEFGERLRVLRKQCKLTQQVVADRLQVHRTTYNKYEAGSVTPDQQGLVRLAEIFGVSVDYLLGLGEEEYTPSVANEEGRTMSLTLQERVLVQLFRQLDRRQQNELVAKVQAIYREKQDM